MKCLKWTLILIIFIILNNFEVRSESIQEFLETLRQKVRNLESNKEIIRDYQPYENVEIKNNDVYDFIIVGSGSSGSALTNRLAEVKKWKILVLEAGGEPDLLSDIPFWSPMTENTDINWQFFTETEPNFALGFEKHRMHWPRGKALGGSSLLNYMVASRGAKGDYDKWANLGNPGWSYEEILPVLKKLERCNVKDQDFEFRGHDGPIFIEDLYRTKAADIFMEAAKNAGYKKVDYNGFEHKGVSYIQGSTMHGFRCAAEKAYIKPIKDTDNLFISLFSHVTKIVIEKNRAKGVELIKNGRKYRVFARNEIILSAGVINSPHILLLSGIGPREQLGRFGIETIVDLPVGQKIYDHPAYWGLGFTVNESIGYNIEEALKDSAFKQLYNGKSGPLHNLGAVETVIFTRTHLAPDQLADVELLLQSTHFSLSFDRGFAKTLRMSKDFYDDMYAEFEGVNALSLFVVVMHPESFGRLELQSEDPLVYPKIYSGYFTDPKGIDMQTMIAGIREGIRVMTSPPFDKYGIKLMDKPMVGCENFVYDSDQYWECAVRHVASAIFHHTTTCKMGPANDKEAVVDNRLRVYGIEKLRVADTSIIPIQITGHTNIPAYVVGEKAAEIIKGEYML